MQWKSIQKMQQSIDRNKDSPLWLPKKSMEWVLHHPGVILGRQVGLLSYKVSSWHHPAQDCTSKIILVSSCEGFFSEKQVILWFVFRFSVRVGYHPTAIGWLILFSGKCLYITDMHIWNISTVFLGYTREYWVVSLICYATCWHSLWPILSVPVETHEIWHV